MGRERMDYVSLFVGDCPLSQTVRIEERILMLAYTYIEKGKFQLTQKPKPVLQGERDAVVRVTLSSICTSDLHIRHGSVPRAVPGITVGHEMVGVVESVGAEVTDLKPGDRVTVNVETFCGECFFCQNGWVNNCTDPQGGAGRWDAASTEGRPSTFVFLMRTGVSIKFLTGSQICRRFSWEMCWLPAIGRRRLRK